MIFRQKQSNIMWFYLTKSQWRIAIVLDTLPIIRGNGEIIRPKVPDHGVCIRNRGVSKSSKTMVSAMIEPGRAVYSTR